MWIIRTILAGGIRTLHTRTAQFENSLDPRYPYMAAGGTAAEHNDAYSSNVSPLSGAGSGSVSITATPMGATWKWPMRGSRVLSGAKPGGFLTGRP